AGSGTVTVKVCAVLVPAAVVTVTARGPSLAAGSITKLAVSDVPPLSVVSDVRPLTLPAVSDPAPATTTLVTDTPPPATVTVVPPATKLPPAIVTATVVPRSP